jgi:hypothetical protein
MNTQSVSTRRRLNLWSCLAVSLAAPLFAGAAHAQEVTVWDGKTSGNDATTYGFEVDYKQALDDHHAFSFAYINEGHFLLHHRDGAALQFWTQTDLFSPRFFVAAGAGPYVFADTIEDRAQDHKGLAADLSLIAGWRLTDDWSIQARANKIFAANSFNSLMYEIGFGYELSQTKRIGGGSDEGGDDWTSSGKSVAMMVGQTVVNIRANGRSIAKILEYRQELKPHWDFTLAAISEGKSEIANRNGVASELWLKQGFYHNRLSMGIGAGIYAGFDQGPSSSGNGKEVGPFAAGLISGTAAFQLTQKLGVRATWHRVGTYYNRDSDIWLGALEYRW